MGSILKPPSITPPPPPPPPPPEPDLEMAGALAEEAMAKAKGRRKGAGSTQVAGLVDNTKKATTQKPTLLG